jgi:hypothetical protein
MLLIFGLMLLVGCGTTKNDIGRASIERSNSLRGTFGNYDAEPRKPDGRVDVDRLVKELAAVQANTYNFLVWRGTNDWEDFKLFLPEAEKRHIRVWVTICPPSECPPHGKNYSEPFRLDYLRWATEIAELSLRETNLAAWSLDDFCYSPKKFTLSYVTTMVNDARRINPRLAFVPCFYYKQVTEQLGREYRPLVDGILFPYRHEAGQRNLSQWDTLEAEIARVKKCFGRQLPVIVDVYATKHSQLNNSTAEYVENVMEISRQKADGVMIYQQQYEASSPEKYHVIKRLFLKWAAEDAAKAKGGGTQAGTE